MVVTEIAVRSTAKLAWDRKGTRWQALRRRRGFRRQGVAADRASGYPGGGQPERRSFLAQRVVKYSGASSITT